MAAAHDVDLLIIGGGCAGLSLARILARHDSDLRTLVVEPRSDYVDDRTWCFWHRGDHRYRHLVRRSWNRWRFSTPVGSCVQESDDISYQCLRSIDFYEDAIDLIRASRNVELADGTSASSIEHNGPLIEVATSKGEVRARYVIDTRPPGPTRDNSMQQVFLGVEVVADRDIFDPDVVGLMDGMTTDDLGFRFNYLLPFDKRRALVEETRFTHRPVTADELETGLEGTLGELGASTEIIRSESGRLPMAVPIRTKSVDPKVVNAGIGGGAVRASSGYAFLRIQQWAGDCAADLAGGMPPRGHAPEPAWRAAVDRLFLRVLRTQPELGPGLFMAMGKQLGAATLVRFLSDDCRPADFARVARVLPKSPFLRQLVTIPA